jgi:phosphotransferase system HPr-like phosphotransfer protein
MTERNFTLCIEGEGAEERAKALADFIEKEFGSRPQPVRQAKGMGPGKRVTRSVDPLTVAAVVLAVPATILAAMDLADRIKKKKKTDSLIQLVKEHPGEVTITYPDGKTIHLHKADSGALLDAAAAAMEDEK